MASWPVLAPFDVWPIHRPRIVSMIGVSGWLAAMGRSTLVIVAAGTNAVDRYGTNMNTNVTELAASGLRTSRAAAAGSQAIARMKTTIMATAAIHWAGPPVGRQPTLRPTPITSAVASR